MNVTKISSKFPPILTKVITVDNEGNVKKSPAAQLTRGTFETKRISTPEELKQLISTLNSNEALLYGIPVNKQTSGTIAARKHAVNGDITRTREAFMFPGYEGWMLLDVDVDDDAGAPDTSWDSIYAYLEQCIPGFKDNVPHLTGDSAGSYIYRTSTGDQLIGERGKRIYIKVMNAGDIPRAGEALYQRLNAKGAIHFKLSKAGTFLERGLIDKAMFQPERLDFCAGAVCEGDCFQERGEMKVCNNDGTPLDTEAVIKDIDSIEESDIENLALAAKGPLVAKQEQVREKWLEEHMAHKPASIPEEDYRKLLTSAADDRVLGADFPIILADKKFNGETVTVADLLADPRRYNGALCLDPLEPSYNNTAVTGKIYLTGARPLVFSFAHGGMRYYMTRKRHTVVVSEGTCEASAERCLSLLAGNSVIYRLGDYLAEVCDGKTHLLTDPDVIESHLDRQIQFLRSNKKSMVPTDCPSKLARRVQVKRSSWGFYKLSGIVTMPIMRLDGSVLDVPGYDPMSRLIYDAEPGTESLIINKNPSHADIENALFRLWAPFREFPFASDECRGGVLAAILTAAVRPVLPTAPGFLINAPAYGTGKTLLARSLSLLTGKMAPASAWPSTEEERVKSLTAALKTGRSSIIFDNVEGNLKSASLAAIMTSPVYESRLLGKSENLEVNTNMMTIFTGNNIYPVADMARRFCVIRIDAVTEHPEKRAFDFSPVSLIQSNILQFRADALAVLRGFAVAGFKRIGKESTGSFEEWDKIVRQCICWLIQEKLAPVPIADPTGVMMNVVDTDPEQLKFKTLMTSWYRVFGAAPTSTADLKKLAEGEAAVSEDWDADKVEEYTAAVADMKEIITEIADDRHSRTRFNSRLMGWFLEKHKDQVIDGICLRRLKLRSKNRTHYAAYRL